MMFRISIPYCFQFRMIKDFKDVLLGKGGDIHYIGGAEVLPPPLDPEEEADVIAELTNPETE